ncbi:MAG: LiaI-LiaF-like domain-containing protein [bacterium]
MTIGMTLIIIGVAFLLKNLGVISTGAWNIIWPGLLIVIGLRLLFKREPWWSDWHGYKRWRRKFTRIPDKDEDEG